MADHTQIDLCPDCDGLRVTELTSLGTVDITLNADTFSFSGPAELYIGPTPGPCGVEAITLPVSLAREIAIDWGLINPDDPPEPTPIQRALDILAPHLAWQPHYRP